MTTGVHDLNAVLRALRPAARDGEYVYAVVDATTAARLKPAALIVEDEGVSVVVTREAAETAGLNYDFVAAWITLGAQSALELVGLTATISSALTAAGISCNVLAGFHQDHLLVPAHRRDDALMVLRGLAD